ncbi:Uncharacterised protein [Serratia fonticola]|nr:Uncharacterised protein [Serratia fonticola]
MPRGMLSKAFFSAPGAGYELEVKVHYTPGRGEC